METNKQAVVKFKWGYSIPDLYEAIAAAIRAKQKLSHPTLHEVIDDAVADIAREAIEDNGSSSN